MAVPLLDIRVNIDGLGLNRIANDGFETDTSGWSVSAGIQGAGSSITRTTGGSPWMGTAVGRLVTTSTNGSGVKFVMSSTFTSGVAYRFRVYLKTVSGNTALGIRLGSLGTAGDRATSTFTVTGTWTAYTVDVTPTGNRTDFQANVYMNSGASAATVDIDAAEVYAVSDDVTGALDSVTWSHGANFEGGLSAGSCTLILKNETNQWSDGANRLLPGMPLYLRATYSGVPYGLWYGITKRATAEGDGRTLTLSATDVVDSWDRTASNVNQAYPAANALAVYTIRSNILDSLALTAGQRNLSTAEAESDRPLIAFDFSPPLSILADIDRSNGTLSFLHFHPSTSVLYLYTTLARNQRSARASAETVSTNIASITADVNEDVNISDQSVNVNLRGVPDGSSHTLWSYLDLSDEAIRNGEILGIHLDTGQQLSAVVTHPEALNVSLVVGYAGSAPTLASDIGRTTTLWSVTGGSGAGTDIQYVQLHGLELFLESDVISQAGTTFLGWHVQGSEITTDYLPSRAAASGYATWITEHVPSLSARYDVTVEQLFPTQVARQVGDLITLTPSQVSAASVDVVIRSLTTTVTSGGLEWSTQYLLDVAGNPTLSGAFILDTSALGGSDVLGY